MKKEHCKNFEFIENDDGSIGLEFGKYKIIQYQPDSDSIQRVGAYFYMIDITKPYKDGANRVSGVFTQNKKLDEFYYDFMNSFFKGTIEQKNSEEYSLIIDELGRREYEEIKKNLREIVKK